MVGMSLAEHLNFFYQLLGQPNTNKYSIALVKEFLDRSESFVNKRTRIIYDSAIFNSTDDTERYSISTNLVDSNSNPNLLLWYIDDVYYSDTNSSEREPLEKTTIEEMDIEEPSWRYNNDNNYPKRWAIDKQSNEIILNPYEATVSSGTNCIEVRYRAKHTKMTRYYTTGTVSITNGSATVTGSDTSFVGNVAVGDKIGIGKLLDPAHSTDFPTTWYTVLTVDNDTQLTLSSNFAEASVSGSNFIASSPSSIDNRELNMCSVLMAMSYAMTKGMDPSKKQKFEDEAIARIEVEKENLVDDADYNKVRVINFRSV